MNKLFLTSLVFLTICNCRSGKNGDSRPMEAPSGYLNETFLKISYALGFMDLIDAEPEVPDDLSVTKNLIYKTVDTTSLGLDLYMRKDLKTPAPLILFIHGGAWRSGDRGDYLPYLVDYANKGYITATVSYRLKDVAPFPAAVQDVSCAIKWIARNAPQYGIDTSRVALVGGSAGAHLAMMVGYGSNDFPFADECSVDQPSIKIDAIVDLYGPVDLTTPYARSSYQVQDFLNESYEDNPGIYKAASPKTYISPGVPPTLIFQGTLDALVPVSQSDSLDIWLSRAGVPHEYHRLKGWPHTMDLAVRVNEYSQYYIDRFLEKHLIK